MGDLETKITISALDKTQQAVASTGAGLKYLEGAATRLSIQFSAMSMAFNSAMGVLRKAVEYIDEGAKALRVEKTFKSMADSIGFDAERLRAAMKKASDGMVDDTTLMQKAIFATAQEIDPDKLPKLFEAARIAARKTGVDVETAIDGMVQGIATNMPRGLKQMGAISKEQLSVLEKAAAAGVKEVNLLDLVLANAAVDSAKFGASADDAGKQIKRFRVELQELKETVGGWLLEGLQRLVATIQGVAGFAIAAASGIFTLLAAGKEAAAWAAERTGDKKRADKLREDAKYWREGAKIGEDASYDLYKKAYANFYGHEYGKDTPAGDVRTPEQKADEIAAAIAARDKIMEDQKKAIANTKAAEAEAKLNAKIKKITDEIERLNTVQQKSSEAIGESALLANQNYIAKFAPGKPSPAYVNQPFNPVDWEEPNLTDKEWLEDYLADVDKLEAKEREKSELIWEQAQINMISTQKELDARALKYGEFYDGIKVGMRQWVDEQKTAAQSAADAVKKAFDGMTDALTDFATKGKADFRALADSIIRDLVRIAIQQSITEPLAKNAGSWITTAVKFVGGLFSGSSVEGTINTSDSTLGSLALVRHSGGIIGSDSSVYRMVPSSVFNSAPRFHGGIGPGERPAIIRNDEGVFTPGQMAALGKGAGSGDSGVTNIIIHANDAKSFEDMCRRNPGAITEQIMRSIRDNKTRPEFKRLVS